MARRVLRLPFPLDLALTLGPLQRGWHDPCTRVAAGEVVRATRTPEGPAAVRYSHRGDRVEVEAYGSGAAWALDHAPATLGFDDDPGLLRPVHRVLEEAVRRLRGLRIARPLSLLECLMASVIEQKVAGKEAWRSWEAMVRGLGEPAPGKLGLLLPPDADRLAEQPYHAFHAFGIERRRADVLRRVGARADRLVPLAGLPPEEARRALTALPGVGPWTAAEVARTALGDADAVSVGDFHTKHLVAWALAGEPRATDERMLELLEPYRGQRGRTVRLLEAARLWAPRFGPRQRLRSIVDR